MLTEIGNHQYVNGFWDGYHGRKQESDDAQYLDGYNRGYATAETESAISEAREYEHC